MRSREDQKRYKWAGVTLGDGPRVKFFPGDVCKLKSDGDFLGSVKDSPKTAQRQPKDRVDPATEFSLELCEKYIIFIVGCISSDRSLHKLSTGFSI